jgi:acyl-CoA reductase-like NAD-dependent aldehyde dehydrogenase
MPAATAEAATYHDFIDGAWVSSAWGNLFESRKPASAHGRIGLFQNSTRNDVQIATAAHVPCA